MKKPTNRGFGVRRKWVFGKGGRDRYKESAMANAEKSPPCGKETVIKKREKSQQKVCSNPPTTGDKGAVVKAGWRGLTAVRSFANNRYRLEKEDQIVGMGCFGNH